MNQPKTGLYLLLYLVVELVFFGIICKIFGVLASVLLVVISSIAGMTLLRSNNIETMRKAQLKAQQGQSPGPELVKGFAISFAAILLIIPGLITSILGLLLLIPGTRLFLGKLFMARGFFNPRNAQPANDQFREEPHRVIDAEFEKK